MTSVRHALALMTGSLLIQIGEMAGWPRDARLVVDGGVVLLGLATLVCIVIGAIRQSSGPRAHGPAITGPASPRQDA
jgi:hypothetical protein